MLLYADFSHTTFDAKNGYMSDDKTNYEKNQAFLVFQRYQSITKIVLFQIDLSCMVKFTCTCTLKYICTKFKNQLLMVELSSFMKYTCATCNSFRIEINSSSLFIAYRNVNI